jgi:hypothetical protein
MWRKGHGGADGCTRRTMVHCQVCGLAVCDDHRGNVDGTATRCLECCARTSPPPQPDEDEVVCDYCGTPLLDGCDCHENMFGLGD